MKSCLSKPEMFCPPLIYSKLGWKTCTFIPNKHHFRRWLISEITFFHQQFFRIKIDLICKTNIWTLPMRKTTSKLRGIKVLRSKSHGNYERFFKIRWLCVHGNSIRNPASRHVCKNNIEVWLYQVKSGGFGGQNYKNA